MAKHGIKASELTGLIRVSESAGWTLCIGAGTSMPVFPTWQELVQDLLTSGPPAVSATDAKKLRDSFPPEALIRASQELLEMGDEDYRLHLTEALYRNIQSKASGLWPTVAKCLMARTPTHALPSEWRGYLAFLSSSRTTAADLASVVLDSREAGYSPNAILSFNAEPLFFSLINAQSVARARKQKGMPDTDDIAVGKGVVDRIEGSTSWSSTGRIPYYFCHGFLPLIGPLPRATHGRRPPATYDSKMVFSESDYLNLANTVFSWQSSVFTRAAMSDRIVFVGLSLTDPNMRRWLAWIHSQRLHEIQSMDPLIRDSTQHLWINVSSGSEPSDRWTEALVSHLGVRIVWLPDWKKAGETLGKMLSLPKKKGSLKPSPLKRHLR
jgi:hypothetical protein